jgi:hypothetical protein
MIFFVSFYNFFCLNRRTATNIVKAFASLVGCLRGRGTLALAGVGIGLRIKLSIVNREKLEQVFNKCLKALHAIHTKATLDRLASGDDDFLPTTNAYQERCFAFLKMHEKRFTSMCSGNVCSISLSNINKLADWIASKSKTSDLIRLSKSRTKIVRDSMIETAKNIEDMKFEKRQEGLRLDREFNDALKTAVDIIT